MQTTINLTPILQALIGLLATVITCWLIPMIKARTGKDQRDLLDAAIRAAVYTAEQLFGPGKGSEKMDYALNWLREKGYQVDSRDVEAAVYELLNRIEQLDITKEMAKADIPPDEDDLK